MRISSLIALTIAVGACGSGNDNPPPSQVVKWTATPGALRTSPDGSSVLDVVLSAHVEPGWKLYSLTQKGGGPVPMSVRAGPDSTYSIDGVVLGPTADRALDPNFNLETETYSGAPTFRLAVKLPPSTDASKPVELKVRSQACSDKLCLPAQTKTVSVTPKAGTS